MVPEQKHPCLFTEVRVSKQVYCPCWQHVRTLNSPPPNVFDCVCLLVRLSSVYNSKSTAQIWKKSPDNMCITMTNRLTLLPLPLDSETVTRCFYIAQDFISLPGDFTSLCRHYLKTGVVCVGMEGIFLDIPYLEYGGAN